MRDTRWIFVEGIMGTGKSTVVEFLTGRLIEHRIPARSLWEGPTVEEPEHPLRIATLYPHPNAIWKDLTVPEFVSVSLDRWQSFAQLAAASPAVTVCDGLLFHGNMTDLLLMDADVSTLESYACQIVESIRALNPVIIFLRSEDVEQSLKRICAARGRDWEAYQIGWKVASPYALRRGLTGFPGLVAIYRAYVEICDAIFSALDIATVSINGHANWDAARRDMIDFLGLPEEV